MSKYIKIAQFNNFYLEVDTEVNKYRLTQFDDSNHYLSHMEMKLSQLNDLKTFLINNTTNE